MREKREGSREEHNAKSALRERKKQTCNTDDEEERERRRENRMEGMEEMGRNGTE